MSGTTGAGNVDYLEARRPTRVYCGRCERGTLTVTVLDSAVPDPDERRRQLSPAESRRAKDLSSCFGWGDGSASSLQLAVALLLDVCGDEAVALRWYEHFAETYVSRLQAEWTVPEVDIALWLYCFENARPGS